jgi:AAA domain/Homeodomain-like domain
MGKDKVELHVAGSMRKGSISLGAFLDIQFSPDQELLGKMILEKSIGLIAGPRGGGKSWMAMIFAYAIAGTKEVSPWGVGSGAPVSYLDGEMRAMGVQQRFNLLHNRNRSAASRNAVEVNFNIISRDYVGNPIGFIDTEDGQSGIDNLIHPRTKLIIVDNLSAWRVGGAEDSNSWATIKSWLIKKRLQGIAVLLIHHTGKNGQQRGSSTHEDLLDYSILLSRVPSRIDRDETRFGIEHTKLRDHIPELRQKYEGAIWTDTNGFGFEFSPAGSTLTQEEAAMAKLAKEGLSMTEIGKQLGCSTSKVSRFLKKQRDTTGGAGPTAIEE